MPSITYIEHNATEHRVDAANGQSLMQAAVCANVPGILADCGGACACATCHVYIDPAYSEALGKPQDMEKALLEFVEHVQEHSRLSCQIQVSDQLEGLIVRLPASQG